MTFSLDDFKVLHKFEGNSLSQVSLVECRGSGEKFVLKRVALVNLERQEQEVRIHRALSHRFIIGLVAWAVSESHLFLLIEFAKHGDLLSQLPKILAAGEAATLKVFFKVAQAVEYLHANGFVHRDIKPENVLLTKGFLPKLADFGSSSLRAKVKDTFCGTFEYMAPEIYQRNSQSHKVDVWALGILLFEMLNGRPPFHRETVAAIRTKLERRGLDFNPGVSAPAIELVYRALRFDPAARPEVAELLEDPIFDPFRDRESCLPHPVSRPSRPAPVSTPKNLTPDSPTLEPRPRSLPRNQKVPPRPSRSIEAESHPNAPGLPALFAKLAGRRPIFPPKFAVSPGLLTGRETPDSQTHSPQALSQSSLQSPTRRLEARLFFNPKPKKAAEAAEPPCSVLKGQVGLPRLLDFSKRLESHLKAREHSENLS